MYLIILENRHIFKEKMAEMEMAELEAMGETGINAYTLQPVAHYGKLFTIETSERHDFENTPETSVVAAVEAGAAVSERLAAAKKTKALLGAAEFLPSFTDRCHAHLFGFYLIGAVRGLGLASFLLRESETSLGRCHGIRSIDLSVDPENKTAVLFYHRNGYRIQKECDDFYGAGTRRLILFKNINNNAAGF